MHQQQELIARGPSTPRFERRQESGTLQTEATQQWISSCECLSKTSLHQHSNTRTRVVLEKHPSLQKSETCTQDVRFIHFLYKLLESCWWKLRLQVVLTIRYF